MRRLFRCRPAPFIVVWWPDQEPLPLPDMPELIGPFRSQVKALEVRNRIREQQCRPKKMAHVTVISPGP